MSDQKNIENLLSKMEEKELPSGYDQRFYAKMEREENVLTSWLKAYSLPRNLGFAAALGSVLIVAFRIVKNKTNKEADEFAVNEEIDLLDDLDILEEWDDKENNV